MIITDVPSENSGIFSNASVCNKSLPYPVLKSTLYNLNVNIFVKTLMIQTYFSERHICPVLKVYIEAGVNSRAVTTNQLIDIVSH